MKIAISGKGGVGKSTLAAALALLLARDGKRVLAVDADPDANLASALGISEEKQKEIIPISQQVALIEERTGAKVKQYGQVFKLNPEVSDIADKFATIYENVALLVLGAVEQGGSGCACPENILIKALITDLVLYKDDSLIMDMEAGVEHLGRATTKSVDVMIIVVEPGQRSIDSARRVMRMSKEISLKNIQFVANKIDGPDDEKFIKDAFPDQEIFGFIPYSNKIRRNDRNEQSVLSGLDEETILLYKRILENIKAHEAHETH